MYTEGITGISVEFNHPEMVVLKGLAEQAKEVIERDKKGEGSIEETVNRSMDLLGDIAIFVEKMLPEEVMSLDGAYKELFKVEQDLSGVAD